MVESNIVHYNESLLHCVMYMMKEQRYLGGEPHLFFLGTKTLCLLSPEILLNTSDIILHVKCVFYQ